MIRQDASTLATMLRRAQDEDRWHPRDDAMQALSGLERNLSISIQAGQPELEAMQASLISQSGDEVMALARADYAACRIASPSLDEMRLLGNVSNVVVHDFSRPAAAAARAA
jgi:hypothetical protein